VITVSFSQAMHGALQRSAQINRTAALHSLRDETSRRLVREHQGKIMKNNIASRGHRAAFFAFSGALLLALAACDNGYGPPVAGQASLTWGQQHYLDNQRYQEQHLDARSDQSASNGH
jgi:hypothetical protein